MRCNFQPKPCLYRYYTIGPLLDSSIISLQIERELLRASLETSREESRDAEKIMADQETTINEMQASIDQMQDTIDELNKQVRELRDKESFLTADIDYKEEQNQHLLKENKRISSLIEDSGLNENLMNQDAMDRPPTPRRR